MSDGDEDGPTHVCRNPGCSEPPRDEFDGCCSTVCTLENSRVGASIRDPRRDAKQAQEADR